MKKVIVTGASALDINITDLEPVNLEPDGRMLVTAVNLAAYSVPVSFISEAARDRVGDIIVSSLQNAGVDTRSIDRYVGGHTPLNLRFSPDQTHTQRESVHYRAYPDGDFDAIWPRVDPDDIILIGDYFAIAPRNIKFIREFVTNCHDRRALTVYAPGFHIHPGKPLTPVKPSLLDNLEMADFVIATLTEVKDLFGAKTLKDAYQDNIAFYCKNFIGIEKTDSGSTVSFFGQNHEPVTVTLPAGEFVDTERGNAKVIAAILKGMYDAGLTSFELQAELDAARKTDILSKAPLSSLS